MRVGAAGWLLRRGCKLQESRRRRSSTRAPPPDPPGRSDAPAAVAVHVCVRAIDAEAYALAYTRGDLWQGCTGAKVSARRGFALYGHVTFGDQQLYSHDVARAFSTSNRAGQKGYVLGRITRYKRLEGCIR